MFFLTPRYLKEAKHYRHTLKRLIHYKEDILPEKDLTLLRDLLRRLKEAMSARSRERIAAVETEIDKAIGKVAPPPSDAGWRENVEVFLVAIVIAAGVRAYFLQPFKIPTGSMQPTLFGVVGVRADEPSPNVLKRAVEFVWLGRSYVDVMAKSDVVVAPNPHPRYQNEGYLREDTYLNFFTFTEIVCLRTSDRQPEVYRVFAPKDVVARDFGIWAGRSFKAGEPILRGHVDTGDQVFVDKMSYNFAKPARGNVFVFKTTGIKAIPMPPGIESQHYIKRLAGEPLDELRIDAPNLYINGKLADLPVFQRVMSAKNGYNGYTNMPGQAEFLTTPSDVFLVPSKSYFALGDNSRNSQDSRFFGPVPEKNVAGRGFFVYWPFSKRWGLIH
jgi:signal peptidase I